MTYAPGKWEPFASPNVWQRDLSTDLRRLKEHWGVDQLVSLIESHEFDFLRIPGLIPAAEAAGIRTLHYPIRDMEAPQDLASASRLVDKVWAQVQEGRSVVFHCWAGIGRTGMMAAACLVAHGIPPSKAKEIIRETRPGTIETEVQERFLEDFEQYRTITSVQEGSPGRS
jgi:rhodanese-related sulfurtransferase